MTQDAPHEQHDENEVTAQPPAGFSIETTPRAVTARGARRAWNEPSVRFWMIVAVLMLLSGLLIGGRSILDWRRQCRMIEHGVQVEAVAFPADDAGRVKNRPIDLSNPVTLDYEYQGKTYTRGGYLFNSGDTYTSGVKFPIRIDPDNARVWTNRTVPPVLGSELVGGVILLICALGSALTAWFGARWHLAVWTNGEYRHARVIDHGQAALAPRSTVVRCAVRVGKMERIYSVFVPTGENPPSPGEQIELIVVPDSGKPIAVQNYYP